MFHNMSRFVLCFFEAPPKLQLFTKFAMRAATRRYAVLRKLQAGYAVIRKT